MGGRNTIVPLKATGVSFLVSDDRIPSCYTTSFSSTATMAVVHVASRRLSRIEVCSLYTENTRVRSAHMCTLICTLSCTRDRVNCDLSRSWASQGSAAGCIASSLHCFRLENQIDVKNLTETLVTSLRNTNYLKLIRDTLKRVMVNLAKSF